jgi:hypothetical protein
MSPIANLGLQTETARFYQVTMLFTLPAPAMPAPQLSALGCDFNRSTQHFIQKLLHSENVFKSEE